MTWKKGQSGNPLGRGREIPAVRISAQKLAPEMLEIAAKIARFADEPDLRLKAAQWVHQVGYGIPKELPDVYQEVSYKFDFSKLTTEELRALREERAHEYLHSPIQGQVIPQPDESVMIEGSPAPVPAPEKEKKASKRGDKKK